ncbi:apolipoprotein N-acyltransferase [bacterium (Candidatus Blackallbacteria) CG17_big_fil_post_rev_8_21_14_2_50_48_46]|uniref:Apolipoprotein N-acyltransferase n=1 Tax=bacterium (Candidatus Blackallbacteria) CG17_big_fil_post_rev_8_21_14_2_50_48_46 TaxID=2014261 RepID=A0A2M7FZH8_9BACT|nr:MAG: apolipoprotein N-acyltransferase [bacterium (Candidatus Blackallbacteria) CG18_big_fil_WC_8_21_14_2_50_49_26]PIW14780.1 MAG: apolipoprotein N-acyltransferase [bacterium (Candidatus Blackallbacteria) CG17_big_fil_post_rev_8_21_14_2_50_48_46]PIW50882.1 MAG: apolipoprotein N-acyltransferase [bacterium (Candidatus Blackallbacteria) CG13_big_fil_rev_8_21_14_2_50_49_14]
MKQGFQIPLCIVSGLLAALSFSTLSTGWLIWFALIPFFHVLYREPLTLRRGAFLGWVFGMGFYIGIIHWLKELHPLTWLSGVTNELSLLIVYGGILGISLVMSFWPALFGAILGWLNPQGWLRVALPALLWVCLEWAQELGDVSLPWARLAITQFQDLPLLQIVPITGSILIAGIIVAFNVALAQFIDQFAPDPQPRKYWHYPAFKPLALLVMLVLALHGYGWNRLASAPSTEPAEPGEGVLVGLVQGSIPQGQKWGNTPQEFWQNVGEIEKIYFDLSQDLLKKAPPAKQKIVIWPESAVPVPVRFFSEHQKQFEKFAQTHQIFFLTGMFDRKIWDSPSFNGAVLFDPQGQMKSWYYKRQLVPFGEFFPFRDFLGKLPVIGSLVSALNPMKDDVAPGTSASLMETPLGKLGTLICFESVYPHVARQSVSEGAQILAIITNDGWYRDAIALYQHNAHAVLRALENSRYVLRAGNTGISGVIDPWGRIRIQSAPMERTYLYYALDPAQAIRSEQTLYTRWGEWFTYLCMLLLLILAFVAKNKISAQTDLSEV